MRTVRAVRIHQTGGAENLRLDEVAIPDPGPGEVRVDLRFAGVNFIDVYFRSGLYDPGPLPAALGREGMGVVDAVGAGVTDVARGDRVAFCDGRASYAEALVL